MEILNKPYIRPKEIATVLDCSQSLVYKTLNKSNLTKYDWGYSTESVAKLFGFTKYYRELMKKGLEDIEEEKKK